MYSGLKYKKLVSILLIIFYLVLFWGFVRIIGPIYLYYLKLPVDLNPVRVFIGIFILGSLIWLNVKLKVSAFAFYINTVFFILLFIPSVVLFTATTAYRTDLFFFSALFMSLLILSGTIKLRFVNIKHNFSENSMLFILVALALILLLPFFITFNFHIHPELLLLKDVYTIRAEAASKFTALHGYFFSWLAKILIPVVFIWAIIKKKYFALIFSIAGLLYLFLVTGHKSVFFSIFIIIPLALKGDYYRQAFRLTLVFLLVIFVSTFIYLLTENLLFVSLFERRLLLLPSVLNNAYFDIFQNFKMHLSHSVLAPFVSSPIEPEPANYVCQHFWGHSCSANTGFLGDGFMNFGYVGVIIEILLVVLLFVYFNSQEISSRYAGLFFLVSLILISSAFLTSLSTHGILLLLLLTPLFLANTNGES